MGHETTRPSLLSRVRDTGNRSAWREFDDRYGALILHYCRACGLQHSDAEDVRQVVMLNLARSLPNFRYSRQRGRFRSYLGRVVRNAVSQHLSRPNRRGLPLDDDVMAAASAANESAVDDRWEQEWVGHHYRLAMQTIRATFEPRSVEVFSRLLAGDPVGEVASAFDMSEQAVHKIKQRIRDRLRELIAVQIRDEDDVDGDQSPG